jgi:hypothetical protein
MAANWARVAVGLATFGFINLVLFLVLSGPINVLFVTVTDLANNTNATVGARVYPLIQMLRTIFGLIFVLSMVGLIVWYFLGTHEEEYEQY